jgi:hypothetical protein
MMIFIGFDILSLDQSAKEDQEGIEKSSKFCKITYSNNLFILFFCFLLVNNLVEEEIQNGISPERIVSAEISSILTDLFLIFYF